VFFPLLPHYKKLLSLDLSKLDQNGEFFFPALSLYLRQELTVIRHLNLSHNKLIDDSLYTLSDVMQWHHDIRGNNSLQTLDLSYNRISVCRLTLEKRLEIFRKNSNITKIDLSANFLNPDCDEILNDSSEVRKNNNIDRQCRNSSNKSSIEKPILNNRLSLYSSKRKNHYVQSILNPQKKLRIYGKNAWIVALACDKNSQHAYILFHNSHIIRRKHTKVHQTSI
jgi:hypothetical protein